MIPLYSQFLDTRSVRWKNRSCGIAALKTVMDYFGNSPSIDVLIKKGLQLNAYVPGVGWNHKGLVRLAEQNGFKAKNFDWFKKTPQEAWRKLLPLLKKRPIIASIHKDFDPRNGGHLIVLARFKNNAVYYNDPISKTRKGISRTTTLRRFLKGWKRRSIVIYSTR